MPVPPSFYTRARDRAEHFGGILHATDHAVSGESRAVVRTAFLSALIRHPERPPGAPPLAAPARGIQLTVQQPPPLGGGFAVPCPLKLNGGSGSGWTLSSIASQNGICGIFKLHSLILLSLSHMLRA